MKKIILGLMILLLLVSCIGNTDNGFTSEIDVDGTYDVQNLAAGKSVKLIVDKDDIIKFPDCTVANSYSITEIVTRGTRGAEPQPEGFVETSLGDMLVVPHKDANDNKASGENLGVTSGKKEYKITHIKSDNDLVITFDEINQIGKTTGGEKDQRGYYQNLPIEEHYHIPTNKLSDISNPGEVAIFQQIINMGGDKYDYGFIKEDKIDLVSNNSNIYGLIDLGVAKTGSISLFSCLEADTRQGAQLRLCIESPVELATTEQDILESKSFSGSTFVYKIKKNSVDAGKEYVVEITRNSSISSDDYEIFNGWGLGDARYIGAENNGKRREQMLVPIKNADNKLVFYVGKVEEDFIFNLVIDANNSDYGKIKLREVTDTDLTSFATLDSDTPKTLQLSPSNGVIGFIIKNTTGSKLTYNVAYASTESTKPELNFCKRGTNTYSCNGTGLDGITAGFNSTDLGSHHNGVDAGKTIVVYLTYEDKNATIPVNVTLSFDNT